MSELDLCYGCDKKPNHRLKQCLNCFNEYCNSCVERIDKQYMCIYCRDGEQWEESEYILTKKQQQKA